MTDRGKERRLPPGWDAIIQNAEGDPTLTRDGILVIVERLLELSQAKRLASDAARAQVEETSRNT